jgi:hypothetical protein
LPKAILRLSTDGRSGQPRINSGFHFLKITLALKLILSYNNGSAQNEIDLIVNNQPKTRRTEGAGGTLNLTADELIGARNLAAKEHSAAEPQPKRMEEQP